MKTYTYKTIGDLEIKADVYRAGDETSRPVVVWIHGGALIGGHREGIDTRVKQRVLDAEYVLVSIDYRLAPETKLPAILEDVEDAFRWVRAEGPALFGAATRRIGVVGGSAGGYLTLACGYRIRPRPAALVAFYGYGDLVGEWYSRPSPHPCHNQVRVTEAEARAGVSGPPVADSRDRKGGGGFYPYCRQHGLWPKEVAGWDPHTETERFYPFMPVRNVTPDYPPTLLIHGTADTDVPFEQSVLMAEELQKHGVTHELIPIEGGEHGLQGGEPGRIDAAYDAALAFLDRHLRGAHDGE